jgi:hypothetical protein
MAVTGAGTNVYHCTAAADTIDGVFVLASVRWVGGGAAGDQCILTDGSGNVLFSAQANGANFTDGWVFKTKWVNGLAFSALTSGTVDIYIAAGG